MGRDVAVSKKGFTLIELLVVIAIIALLLSIVMPALKSVKDQGKKTVCLAHMKGMGTLLLTYGQENDDELVSCDYRDFPDDRGTAYYSYYQNSHTIDRGGPSGMGWLWKAGLIESESDLPFCPSTYYLFASPMPTKEWNPNGRVEHWNYCGTESNSGIDAKGTPQILWDRDREIDWLPLRLTVGTRILRRHMYNGNGVASPLSQVPNPPIGNLKTIADASLKGKRAFLSDLWASNIGTWSTTYKSINHKSGGRRSLNFWSLDGSADNRKMEDEWFEPASSTGSSDDRKLRAVITWSDMFR